MLNHERLDVYQCALRFAALSFRILEGTPRGQSELSEQLRRATLSIPLNIAEGTGKAASRERARYYAIARGSAMECGAVVDLLRLQGLITEETGSEAKEALERIVAMLTKMCL
jgi:four helix bundle protein